MATRYAQQLGAVQFPRPFGKYTLLHRLATGGMAELFLALHRSTAGFEKLVVIKRALPIVNHEETFISMLLHEARIAATLSHPNIVQIYDVGQMEGTHFIAMEHVHGEDLRAIQRQLSKQKGVLPLEHALYVAIGLCSGLSYAHEKCDLAGHPLRIVHRDISPHNVLVSYSGDVKLVDFGVAKSRVQLGDQTRAGNIKGKVPYMSPEQALGHPIDARSDVFAIGTTLYELTTGRRLFKGRSDYETLRLVGAATFAPPSSVKRDYPPELEAILMKALTRYPEDRYQSARELQLDLERFVHAAHLYTSALSLSAFMHGLFGDKLRHHDAMLANVKLVADSALIDQSHPFQSDVAPAPTRPSAPAEASVSDINPREKGGGWGWLGFAAASCRHPAKTWRLRRRAAPRTYPSGKRPVGFRSRHRARDATSPSTASRPDIRRSRISHWRRERTRSPAHPGLAVPSPSTCASILARAPRLASFSTRDRRRANGPGLSGVAQAEDGQRVGDGPPLPVTASGVGVLGDAG